MILLCLSIPFFVYIEFNITATNCGEIGLVELSQELILAGLILGCFKFPISELKLFSKVLGSFFAIILVRELDFVFDEIDSGFWFKIVIVILVGLVYYIYNKLDLLRYQFNIFHKKSSIQIFVFGICVVFIFSRLFGTGKLWRIIMLEDYIPIVKTVVQEGLELLGYGLILFSLVIMKTRSNK